MGQDDDVVPMEQDLPTPAQASNGKGKVRAESSAAVAPAPSVEAFNSLPWVEKYRPSSLSDLVAHEDIISILNRLIEQNQLPHLLFYGPPGTGKTSTILACARRLYGSKYSAMTLELNASDDRGIDVVRDQIKEFAGTKKLFSSGVKLVILDEADHMTNDAQFALRCIIEKYTKNTRFCLICNYVSKIIPALQSRCTRFRFAPLAPDHVRDRVQHIIATEKLNVKPDGVDAFVRLAQGDMRRVLNVMQATAMAYDPIDEEAVYLSSGNPLPKDIDAIIQSLFHEPFTVAYKFILDMTQLKGYSLADLVRDIMVVVPTIALPGPVLAHLFDKMAMVEYHLAGATSEKIQLAAMVGAFAIARDMLTTTNATETSGNGK